jgi:hypothetical protein
VVREINPLSFKDHLFFISLKVKKLVVWLTDQLFQIRFSVM